MFLHNSVSPTHSNITRTSSVYIGINFDKKGRGPDHGERGARAYNRGVGWSPQRGPRAEPLVRGSGAKPPEAESFLRIGHPKEGANWPHVRVYMREIVILGKGALWNGKGIIWSAPEATNIRLLHVKGIKLILPSTYSVTDRQINIIVAIARTAKNLKLYMPFTLRH